MYKTEIIGDTKIITYKNGTITYYHSKKGMHRLDGPASIGDTCIVYYKDDLEHRMDGPSTIYVYGELDYAVFGKEFEEDQYYQLRAK